MCCLSQQDQERLHLRGHAFHGPLPGCLLPRTDRISGRCFALLFCRLPCLLGSYVTLVRWCGGFVGLLLRGKPRAFKHFITGCLPHFNMRLNLGN
ncbi:hypothetical protein FKM82_014692 [Ascaphus truei]